MKCDGGTYQRRCGGQNDRQRVIYTQVDASKEAQSLQSIAQSVDTYLVSQEAASGRHSYICRHIRCISLMYVEH